jgi:hypothetical protein
MWPLRILKESTKVSTIGGSFFRLYRVMRRFFKTFPCTIGWHKTPKVATYNGCNLKGSCQRCNEMVMQDSQGNWF